MSRYVYTHQYITMQLGILRMHSVKAPVHPQRKTINNGLVIVKIHQQNSTSDKNSLVSINSILH